VDKPVVKAAKAKQTSTPVIKKAEVQKPAIKNKVDSRPVLPKVQIAAAPVVVAIPAPVITPAAPEKIIETKLKKTAPVVEKNAITPDRLNNFVTEFSLAYEEGDIDSFMAFFTENASTNDARDKAGVRVDYEKLFSSTDMRVIDLDKLKWKIKKQKAIGKGKFDVTVLASGGDKMKKFAGALKLEIVSEGNALKLKGMFHAYDANE